MAFFQPDFERSMDIKMKNYKKRQSLILALLIGIFLTGCGASTGLAHDSNFESAYENSNEVRESQVGRYDSADTVVIGSISEEEKKITLVNVALGKDYTLNYDGTTMIRDKYDSVMSMAQMKIGDIVEVHFLKEDKKLATMTMSKQAWSFESIEKYSLNELNRNATIGDELYSLKKSTSIYSEGKQIEVADVVSKDVVSIKGIGRNILSIVVEKGHGYLRLQNDAYVIGGWIEVGQSVIQQITDDMLLTVPEGKYNVHITSKGVDTIRTVTIERNKEAEIDLSDIEIEEVKMGQVYFTVLPSSAIVYVDGKQVDTGKAVEMDYGLHQIICEATGYDTVTQYVKVSQAIASITITMDESTEEEVEQSSSVSGNSLTTGSYRIYIESPKDVEIYQDGIYMGISPVNFTKIAGSHTITLRKDGYVTRSYTIQVDNTESDVTYSFTELVSITSSVSNNQEDVTTGSSNPTVSGNTTVSGNKTVSDNSTVSGSS